MVNIELPADVAGTGRRRGRAVGGEDYDPKSAGFGPSGRPSVRPRGSASWYERVLGMTREDVPPAPGKAAAIREIGRQKINLWPIAASKEDWFTADHEAAGSEDLCFLTDATPDQVVQHLRAERVAIEAGPGRRQGALGTLDLRLLSRSGRQPDRDRVLPSGLASRSGDSLFGEVTFANSDFTSLGLTPGTYVWSWAQAPMPIRSRFRLASQSPRPGRCCWRDLAAWDWLDVAGRERLGRSAEAKEAVARGTSGALSTVRTGPPRSVGVASAISKPEGWKERARQMKPGAVFASGPGRPEPLATEPNKSYARSQVQQADSVSGPLETTEMPGNLIYYALVLIVIALVAALLGFGGARPAPP